MPKKTAYCRSRMTVQPLYAVCRRRLVLGLLIFFSYAGISWAGECITTDEDLYNGVVSFSKAAKKGDLDSMSGNGDLYCWRGNERLNTRIRSVLTEMLFDSRIHPAHVAAALKDYQSVFGDPKPLLSEVRQKQGQSRYALIAAICEDKGAAIAAATVRAAAEAFSADVDFIDGPANIRKEPKGALVATLPDNARVRILATQDNWVEIMSDGVRGWTSRANLMGSHVGGVDADGFYVLSRAAFMGYFETVRFLLSRGAQPDLVDSFGRNALHWAVRGGFAGLGPLDLETMKLLCAIPGVNANRMDKEGMTPLLTSITLGRMDMAKVLLGVKTIDVNVPGQEGLTPLMLAIQENRTDIIGALLSAQGLNVDAVDERGRTALYHAVALGDLASMRLLSDRKARTDFVTKDGKTLLFALFEPRPWRLTADAANIETVKFLTARKDIDINKADANGNTAMFIAIEQDNPDMVKSFLERPDLDVNRPTRDGGRYLHRVIGLSNLQHGYEMAMLLLDREEIDVNASVYRGETIVHMGWYNSGMGTHGLELAKKILTRRPAVNRENGQGETPLVYNIKQNHPEMVRLLAGTKGVDLNLVVHDGRTPLGIARYRNNPEIIEILKKAGAREFPFIGSDGRTPEGIPQSLLQTVTASQAIVFYRGYLLSTTDKTLQHLGDKKADDAVQLQEFILDEIVSEMGDSMPKYSAEQRKQVIGTFASIRDHFRSHPRSQSAWFKILPEDKKKTYAKMDKMRDEVLGGKYDATRDGELVNHPPMVPILILRDYMAKNSIKALGMLKEGKTAEAGEFLKEVRDLSDQKDLQQQEQYWKQ